MRADNCKRVQWFAYEFRHIWTLCFNIPLVQPLSPLGAGWLTVSQAPNYAKNALYPLVQREQLAAIFRLMKEKNAADNRTVMKNLVFARLKFKKEMKTKKPLHKT
ncbi:hypothetical protein IHE44_0006779 [Lamprotornis superbus]|uniref:Uncharacterized protein n=1 Tax=Lamprotornis superbus TaxID=245042 RepID=A0A835NHY6_9PASS|nr:hypothetical protein IHE44_0006779 [Lamprotornis superbus]